MGKFIDRTGQRFGRWLVLERSPRKAPDWPKRRIVWWKCRCDCGHIAEVISGHLANGTTTSCGCYRKENPSSLRHGHARKGRVTKEWTSWSNMKRRCYDPRNEDFHTYGGRGITVCDRWRYSFANFLKDMGERPGGLTLNRKDNDGNYEPGNCEWATEETQANNKTSNTFFEIDGQRKTMAQWCRIAYKRPDIVWHRLKLGWNFPEALFTPVRRHHFHE